MSAAWGPANFQAAYNLPSSSKGRGQIVAIVDAFDNPNVASDLATYRANFGLRAAHFTKYNAKGETRDYPSPQQGWAFEEDLDVEMVSAVCPYCTIYLVEAKDNTDGSLDAAEQEAVKLGAHIVSNGWGGGPGDPSGGAYDAPGVTFLASAGDNGYGMQDPADYARVVSVGGTVLSKRGSTYSEVVWRDTGGGCSVVSKPSWQRDPTCSFRTGNDVSAAAWDAASYDTYDSDGWGRAGGTSISAPLIAGVFALAGNASSRQSGKAFWTFKNRERAKALHAITRGTVSACPRDLAGTYLCSAGTGQFESYSGPAGWGTPNGIGGF